MKMKYCPHCAGMDIFKNSSGIEQCRRCNFIGEMREGSVDEINSAKKRILLARSQNIPVSSAPASENPRPSPVPPTITNKELRERLEKLQEKKKQEFEEV